MRKSEILNELNIGDTIDLFFFGNSEPKKARIIDFGIVALIVHSLDVNYIEEALYNKISRYIIFEKRLQKKYHCIQDYVFVDIDNIFFQKNHFDYYYREGSQLTDPLFFNSIPSETTNTFDIHKKPYCIGTLISYNKDTEVGFIEDASGFHIPFYIQQINDFELQRIIQVKTKLKIPVKYKEVISELGLLLADNIYRLDPQKSNLKKTNLQKIKKIKYKPLFSFYDLCVLRSELETIITSKNNDFKVLPKLSDKENYYTQAKQLLLKKENSEENLKKTESLLIKALQNNNNIESAIANLTNIYLKQGGYSIIKGFKLLSAAGIFLPCEKLINITIQLLKKTDYTEALKKVLSLAFVKTSNEKTFITYKILLADLLYKAENWFSATKIYSDLHIYILSNIQNYKNWQNLAKRYHKRAVISYYLSNNDVYLGTEQSYANCLAYLQEYPDDEDIKAILNGTFTLKPDNYEAYNEINNFLESEIPFFFISMLDGLSFADVFNTGDLVNLHIREGVFKGTEKDLVNNIKHMQITKLNTEESPVEKYKIHVLLAKMASHLYKRINSQEDYTFILQAIKYNLANGAKNLADYLYENKSDENTHKIATIAYLYIQFLLNLQKNEFDASHLDADTYFPMSYFSPKDFLVATFMLYEKKEYAYTLFEKALINDTQKLDIEKFLNKIIDNIELNTLTEKWENAYEKYNKYASDICIEIIKTADDFFLVENININIQSINRLLNVALLWDVDIDYVKRFIAIMYRIKNTFEEDTVNEKIDSFKIVECNIRLLKKDIKSYPTEISYNMLLPQLDTLEVNIREKFNELYSATEPECTIAFNNGVTYINDNIIRLIIQLKNTQDKQNANAIKINLDTGDGATLIQYEKNVSSIKSGELQEFIAKFFVDDTIVNNKQFKITIDLEYSYYNAVDSLVSNTITKEIPVQLTNKELFVKINNNYDQIIRGNSIDINRPELFKGRDALIESLCNSLSSENGIMSKNRGIMLWGQKRVGKNSIKDFLKERIKTQYPDSYIIIELGSVGSSKNIREFLASIINKIKNTLRYKYKPLYAIFQENNFEFNGSNLEKEENYMYAFSQFMDDFSSLLQEYSEPEKNIPLFFVDEFTYIYEWIEKDLLDGTDFMRFWKSFIQDYGICAVILAQDSVPTWKSKYENEFSCMNYDNEISYLDYIGSKALISEPCRINNTSIFSEDAIELLYSLSCGSAFLLVICCKHIIDYVNENYINKVTKGIVRLIFEKKFMLEKGMFSITDFDPQISDVIYIEGEAKRVNSLNKKVLEEIAIKTKLEENVNLSSLISLKNKEEKIASSIIKRLAERKIINLNNNSDCSITMPLLSLILLREQSDLKKEDISKLVR